MTCADIVATLAERDEKLACAESLTGGLLAAEITAVPGASAVFTAGVVAYTAQTKTSILGVLADMIAEAGPVSMEVAFALAAGVRAAAGADWGVSTTGVAGPEPHGGQPPGTVWVAVASPSGEVASRQVSLSGDRAEIRDQSVVAAVKLLSECLELGTRESVVPAE